MWCIGRITAEYRERMYGLLAIYARLGIPVQVEHDSGLKANAVPV